MRGQGETFGTGIRAFFEAVPFPALLAFLLGAGFLVFGSLIPIAKWMGARSWVETPCQIVRSEESYGGEDSDYRATTIEYDYFWENLRYTGLYKERVPRLFLLAYTDNLAAQYPAGEDAVCYVNPRDPSRSTLTLRFRPGYLTGLFGLIPFALGLHIAGRLRRERLAAAGAPVLLTPTVWEARVSWITEFVCLILANAIAVALAIFFYREARASEGDVSGIILIAALVGLFWWVPVIMFDVRLRRKLLTLRNPRPFLRLTPGAISVGNSAVLEWTLRGQVYRIRRLRIWLEGRDEILDDSGEGGPGSSGQRSSKRSQFSRRRILTRCGRIRTGSACPSWLG